MSSQNPNTQETSKGAARGPGEDLSHALRNHLAVVVGYGHLVERRLQRPDGTNQEAVLRALARVRQAVARMGPELEHIDDVGALAPRHDTGSEGT